MIHDFSKNLVFMAPMAGITDQPFRKIAVTCGAKNFISEMVAINAIQRKNPKTYRIADVHNEPYPVTVQLVGNDPDLFAQAAELVAELGAAAIDINMGCPVKKIVHNNAGSALMKDLLLASKIIEKTVRATSLKVSVKFRKGWDNEHVNAVEFAKMCEQSGASYVTVHGRTRAQGYSGNADWNIIAAVKDAVHIPVIGNGDIDSPEKALEMMTFSKVDGVMVGRAALGNPWLYQNIEHFLCTHKQLQAPSTEDIKNMLLNHIRLLVDYYDEHNGIAISRKYVGWYVKSFYAAKKFREQYTKLTTLAEAENLINQYFSEIQV